jgi:hypothetical protein
MSVVENPTGTQLTTNDVTFAWRKARFEELGFSEGEANALAQSKEVSYTGGRNKNERKLEWETPLHFEKVKKALDNGCTHYQALQIFVTI